MGWVRWDGLGPLGWARAVSGCFFAVFVPSTVVEL